MNHSRTRAAFTLRFRNERTHRALRHAAEELGVSMNELAERAIEHELGRVGAELEEKLERTVRLLSAYRPGDRQAEIRAFARAEVEQEDPLRSRAAEPVPDPALDPVGVGDAFADPVES